jgi:hypothetical protein
MKPLPQRLRKHCGAEFTAHHHSQDYCSIRCRRTRKRKAARERYLAHMAACEAKAQEILQHWRERNGLLQAAAQRPQLVTID